MSYIVISRIKENGKIYNPGEAYDGENVEAFLASGIIEGEKRAKPRAEAKEDKKDSKKED